MRNNKIEWSIVFFSIFLLLLAVLPARAVVIDSDNILDAIKSKSSEMLFGVQVKFRGPSGLKLIGALMQIYTIHNGIKKGEAGRREWAYVGIGYGHFEGGQDRLQAGVLIDLIAISNKFWKQVFAGHVDVTPLPNTKFGPIIQAPDLNRLREAWVIGDRTGLQLAWKFGSTANN